MSPSVNYQCPCMSPVAAPPPPHLPSSAYAFHPLHHLYFCEECDAIRCNRCVSVEVSVYYCPNCLFEVPSASVRAEKNRCARNCFLCPHCRNTLSVVPSDPPDTEMSTPIPVGSVGEPPFFLYCNHCRWDSAEVGITFEKPTGLALQLQKTEDSAPDSLEFERLKEHFEPFLRASSSSQAPNPLAHAHHINPVTAAASSALARDVPGVSKYTAIPMTRSRSNKDKSVNKDEMPNYKSRLEIGGTDRSGHGGETDIDLLKHLEVPSEIAALEQRWVGSWATPLEARSLKPLRIPLRSKLTKRCHVCRHILIKPEQKAQSIRYKIKLMAANYLPAIAIQLPHAQAAAAAAAKRASSSLRSSTTEDSAGLDVSVTGMMAGKTYPFQLALTNPLYDPIHVRLTVQRSQVTLPSASAAADPASTEVVKPRRPPFAISLPTSTFSIAPFAEDWEYEDDEMFGTEDEDAHVGPGNTLKERATGTKSKTKTVGVLEKKANVTVVGGEVIIGKEGQGDIKFNMLLSYTYRSDDPAASDDNDVDTKTRGTATKAAPEMKTFSFYTLVDLGVIIPREESRVETETY